MTGAAGDFRIDHDPDLDLLRVEYVGRITPALMRRHMADCFAVPGVGPGTRLLVVCTLATLDALDLDSLLDFQADNRSRGYLALRAAVVVPDRPGDLALAELWAATRHGGKSAGARVFTRESDAREWLLGLAKNFR